MKKVSSPSAPASARAEPAASEREPRGSRRKRETRGRLIEAAFRLMATRGVGGVNINEITEEADVGIGSFYNHFDSKESLHAAVVDEVFEGFADALERLAREVKDPAEIIAVCVRHTILRARREPLWARFLVREGFSSQAITRGLGARLLRDIQTGIVSGRFKIPDPMMSFVAAGSTVLGAVSAQLQLTEGDANLLPGADAQHLAERAAAVVLHGLGLTFDKADQLARKPLPIVEAGP